MVETGGVKICVEQNVLRAGGVTISRILAVLEPSKPVEAGEGGGEDLGENRGAADSLSSIVTNLEEQLDSEAGDVVDVDYSLPHLTKPMTTPGLAIGLVGQPHRYVQVLIIC